MSEPEPDQSTEEPTDDERDSQSTGEPADDGRDVRELLLRGVLVVLGLVAVVALFQFYSSALAVINEWIAREYRALFRAMFNLVVLLAAGVGISLVLRELSGSDG